MRSIHQKLLLYILGPTIIFLTILATFIGLNASKIMQKNANELMEASGAYVAGSLETEFEKTLQAVRATALTLGALVEKDNQIDREAGLTILQEVLQAEASGQAAWMYWEKDSFDGNDRAYRNERGHSQTGMYIPMWSKAEEGRYALGTISGYETEEMQQAIERVMKHNKPEIWEPFYHEIAGKEYLVTSVVYPIQVQDKVVGVVGVDITLDQVDGFVDEFVFYDTGFASMMSNEGTIMAHRDDVLLQNYFSDLEDIATEADQEAISSAINNGETITYTGSSKTFNEETMRIFRPIEVSEIEKPWFVMVAVPKSEVMKFTKDSVNWIVFISIVVIILLSIIIMTVSRSISKPIESAATAANLLAAGDLTFKITPKYLARKDEIGALAASFQKVSMNMRTLIEKLQTNTEALLSSSQTVASGTVESREATSQVASSITNVSGLADSQMNAAIESAQSMEEMANGVQRVADAASNVSNVTSDMTKHVRIGMEKVTETSAQMTKIQAETNETQKMMHQLQDEANKIEQIVATISEISSQTNLLALNAAIEAARAGESGKGFAVVADEVRKLADETNTSADNIQKLIQFVQDNIVHAVKSMDTNVQEVDQGRKQFDEVALSFDDIQSAVANIMGDMEDLTAVAEEMSAVSEEITATSEEIASSAEDTSMQTEQVAAAAEEQLAAMEEMQQVSEQLQKVADELQTNTAVFKL